MNLLTYLVLAILFISPAPNTATPALREPDQFGPAYIHNSSAETDDSVHVATPTSIVFDAPGIYGVDMDPFKMRQISRIA